SRALATLSPFPLHAALPIGDRPAEAAVPRRLVGDVEDRAAEPSVDGGRLPLRKRHDRVEPPGLPFSVIFSGWLASPIANWICPRSEEHTSELQSLTNLVCRL